MGDDEYTEDNALGRKLANAHLISAALDMQLALRALVTGALHEKRSAPGIGSQAEQVVHTALAKSEGKA